ncbi:MAG: cyclase family protein [Planctomycetaceae bacterium]
MEWFFADGVVLDMTAKADGERIGGPDVAAALLAMGYALKPLDIVLVRTGRDALYGQPDYVAQSQLAPGKPGTGPCKRAPFFPVRDSARQRMLSIIKLPAGETSKNDR